ncbi:MAG: hypothetical protein CVV24_11125 [Ignavibacteriae bacterium HGW-Ignavibacteriae-3]|nr:MAG: hypothetical protein CVV24_11125 [Ignavibacteriae bacterium HGW-Ignavibacteriae-3]
MLLIKPRSNKLIKNSALIFLSIFLLCFQSACTEPELLPSPNLKYSNILYGQVFNLSHPGPIPIGWKPPPYEVVSIIIVQDINQKILIEAVTDNKGKFRVAVPDGSYYLHLKDSIFSDATGPFKVQNGDILEVIAYFDNGMR